MGTTGDSTSVECRGGCHCGAVRFSVRVSSELQAFRCNCSICRQTGFVHVFVRPERFTLLQGADDLSEYRFHTRTARHLFCRHCGVKSFYVPRSHPDAYSVNLNCLDLPESVSVSMGDFDGRNWSRSIDRLRRDERNSNDE